MKSNVKRLTIYSAVIILIGIGSSLLYFNSNYYLNKQADKKRQERLSYLDSIKRRYVYEGVYRFQREMTGINFKRDKFGNIMSERINNGYKNYEISFTSNKLIILNTEKNIKEEIVFKNKYELAKVSDNDCAYTFYIDTWQIRHQVPDEFILDVLPTIKDDDLVRRPFRLSVTLNVADGKKPYFFAYYGFQIPLYEGEYSNSNSYDPFSRPAGILSINLDEIVYSYNSGVPDYVRLSRYQDFEYDLDSYREDN